MNMNNPEIVPFEVLAKELLRRCMADEEPEELRRWLSDAVAKMGVSDDNSLLSWDESFGFVDMMLAEYEAKAKIPKSEQKILSWPWESWAKHIDPLDPGMLGLVTAPDGQGKTMFAECIAEHWAKQKNKIVFVHYELNWKLMMLRRTARHTYITVREMKDGKLTQAQKDLIATKQREMRTWEGNISYLHSPGWTMEKTTAELSKLVADGKCDAVVIDYLEKAASSNRQLRMFGSQHYMREADNVEQLKIFSERTEVPIFMVAQMSKDGKKSKTEDMDRTGIRGAGEKSDKANLVVLLKRDKTDTGYSNIVDVAVDKNTMGATARFQQMMRPEYFQVSDIDYGKR